jgi:hypothetical protein
VSYFSRIDDLDTLKSEYRRLALENHPDRGGNVEVMQEINGEFALMFRIIEKRGPKAAASGKSPETAADFRNEFYTQNGWKGSRYDRNLSLKEIAVIVRGYVKDVYPTYKFSVTTEYFSGGCTLYVRLMEVPENIFDDEGIRRAAKDAAWNDHWGKTEEMYYAEYQKKKENFYVQQWSFYYEWFTETARAVLEDVKSLVESYRYSDCDGQIDYFHVSFWRNFYIGRWDHPLKIVSKKARIHTSKDTAGAQRIEG